MNKLIYLLLLILVPIIILFFFSYYNESDFIETTNSKENTILASHLETNPNNHLNNNVKTKVLLGSVLHMHIPKCAGASLHRELAWKCKDYKIFSNEVCHDYLQREEKNMIEKFNFTKNIYTTMIRDPISHVYSQYLECKYDGWGKTVTRNTSFPRNYSDIEGFDLWLDHFDETWDIKKGFFNCYIPFNAQTRAFTCTGGNNHYLLYNSKFINYKITDPLYPDIDIAMNNSIKFHVIGVVEYYDASICLFLYNLYNKLNEECQNLCKNRNKVIDNSVNKPNFHEKHNVPGHNTTSLSPSIINKIERLTKKDKMLYNNLLKRFLNEIKVLETKYETKLLC